MNNKKMIKLLTLYLDDALDTSQKNEVEKLLLNSSEARKIFEELKLVRASFLNQIRLDPSPFFWSRLSHRLEHEKSDTSDELYLPVPRKYLPALGMMALLAIAVSTILFLQNSGRINQYVAQQVKTVKSFYEASLGKTLFPFLSDVSNDDVFSFAVGGYVPVKNSDKVIEFGNTSEQKYWVKLKKNAEVPSVQVEDFSKAVALTALQKEQVDNVLSRYKPDLEKSILLASKDTMAIASRMWDMNNAIIFDIARTLDNTQRKAFEEWVSLRNPEMQVRFDLMNFTLAEKMYERAQHVPEPNQFVFVTPETTYIKNFVFAAQNIPAPPQPQCNMLLDPYSQSHRNRVIVSKKSQKGSQSCYEVTVNETNHTSADPVVIQIEASDPDVWMSQNIEVQVRDSLVRQLRKIRIPKQAMHLAYTVTETATRQALNAARQGLEQLNMMDIPQHEIMRMIKAFPESRRIAPYSIPAFPQNVNGKHLNMFIDSVITKMRDVEKNLESSELKYDSLAHVYDRSMREAKNAWRDAIHNMIISDTAITIMSPDSQVIHVKKKIIRK